MKSVLILLSRCAHKLDDKSRSRSQCVSVSAVNVADVMIYWISEQLHQFYDYA